LSIKVKKFINENTTIWDNFINSSNNGALFHYRSFLNYHENIQFEDHSLLFYKDDKLIAILPAAIKEDYFISHPGISFASFIYQDKLSFIDSNDIVVQFLHYVSQLDYKHIRITLSPSCYSNAVSDYIEFCLYSNGFEYQKIELSNIVELGENFEDLYNTYKSSSRQAHRKAERSDISVKQSDNFDEFYDILCNNLALRHNVFPTHTLSELKKLKKLFPKKINLFSAELDGEIIGGVINFICNQNTVLAFYISHKSDFQNFRPLNIIFSNIFQWAITNHYKYYDFGLVTVNGEPNLSLARFKESFGATGTFRKTMILDQ